MKEIEEKILSEPEIRLERTLRKRKETPLGFLVKFFMDYNEKKDTIYVESKKVQTRMGHRRSINDIYRIMNYYYPDLSFKDFVKHLHVDLPEHMPEFRSSFCYRMKRRAYYWDGRRGALLQKGKRDQFGMTWNDWVACKIPESMKEEKLNLRELYEEI